MKKIRSLVSLGLLLGFTAEAQMPTWCLPPYLINFTGTSPVVTSSSLSTGTYYTSSNAAYDKAGNMLFYVANGNITTAAGTVIGGIFTANETAIVPVPGLCTRYYVISISTAPMATVYLRYSMVETSGGISIVPGFNNVSLGEVGGEFAGLAVSKLRSNKTRFLFTIGRSSPGSGSGIGYGANKFIIDDKGISFQSTITNVNAFGWENKPFEVELYENPASGTMKLAWGGSHYSSDQEVHVLNLNSAGNFVSIQNVAISGLQRVYGVEFASSGNKILVAQDNSVPANRGIAIVDLPTSSCSFIGSSSTYYQSQIERAYDGKYYVLAPSGQFAYIDPATATITSIGLTVSVSSSKLPDQVDDENYTGVNFKAQLMARDNSVDIGQEANLQALTSSDMWASPDIWNRRNNIGSPNDHQNPGYVASSGLGNLMKMRVKNIGCSNSNTSYVRLYWTLASTGEHWPASWDGTDVIGTVPAGGEITTTSGYSTYTINGYAVPALPPGGEAVISAKWFPPDPSSYPVGTVKPDAGICFLGRIDDPVQDPMYSEVPGPIKNNVYKNNNIVTRNTSLINLPGIYMIAPGPKTTSVMLHNYYTQMQAFNFSFTALSQSSLGFANTGTITLTVDNDLWNSWVQSGSVSSGLLLTNQQLHQFTVTDLNNAELKGINMSAGQYMNVTFGFELNGPTNIEETYAFGVSQERADWQQGDDAYGSNCNFIVSVNGLDDSDTLNTDSILMKRRMMPVWNEQKGDKGLQVSLNTSGQEALLQFSLAEQEEIVSLTVFDLSGKLVKQIAAPKQTGKFKQTMRVLTADLENGIYIVRLQTTNGLRAAKINVIH